MSTDFEQTAQNVGEAIEDTAQEVQREVEDKVDRVEREAEATVAAAETGLRERKREAKEAVDHAATVVAEKADRAANKTANTVDRAADKTADAAHQAANTAGSAVKDIQTRIMHGVDVFKRKITEYSKDPSQIGHAIKNQLESRVHERLLVIFLIMWAPIWIMVAGSGIGQIVNLFFHNIQYFLGLGATGYVYSLLTSNQPTPNYQQKTLLVFLISSTVPIIVLDIESVILKIVAMLAFSGAPFLFSLIYSGDSVAEKDLNKLTAEERLIQFSTATSVIFGLSILPGDNSIFHRIFIAAIFGAAAYGAHFLIPIVVSKIPPAQKPLVEPHQVVVFGLLELILANLLLFILSFVLPQSVLDAEHSGFAVIGFSLFGLIFLAGGNALSTNFLVGKVPPPTLDMIKRYGALAIVGSYVVLMLAYVLHLRLFGFGAPGVMTVTVNQ